MSFTNAPVTRSLVLGLAATSIAASLFDTKHYFYILIDPHILRYSQAWRALLYQLCYTNSSEVLFASMALYNMRVVERMWGSRKYASFIITTACITAFLPPVAVALLLRPLTFGAFNYLPAGPTAIIFALLAQYHAMIPHIYKYRLALSTSSPASDESAGLTFSDKSYRYLLAVQLALFQWPGSLLGALVGWAVGYSWRNDLLPAMLTRWRIPGWVVGVRTQKRSEGFEGLRRRLEGEDSPTATTTGAHHVGAGGGGGAAGAGGGGDAGRRRTMGQQIIDQVRGAF